MRTIAFAASKGGVGKTTLTATFSVEASKKGRIALIDLDPQQSLAVWHETRGSPDNPHLIAVDLHSDAAKIASTIRQLGVEGYDYAFLDTPPGNVGRTLQAVKISDLVVIPVRPSPIDLQAIDPVIEMCEMQDRPFVFVLNQVQPPGKDGGLTAGAQKYLASRGKTLEPPLGLYNQHPGSMMSGQVASELKGRAKAIAEAKEEIATLWRSIVKELGGASGKPAMVRGTSRSV
jgi:chromosome partitioning protein